MNPVVSSSLIHYTKTIKSLKGIISNGFRYSYCEEKFPKALVNNMKNIGKKDFVPSNVCTNDNISNVVLIPMISFCDIPLTRSEVHAYKYGFYGVGIDREIARSVYSGLMPVQYMADERYQFAMSELSTTLFNNKFLNPQIINSIKLLIGTTKAYATIRKGKEVVCYEEREWRIICNDENETKWGWGLRSKRTKIAYNKRLHAPKSLSYLSFLEIEDSESRNIVEQNIDKLITHIIVRTDSEVQEISEYIMDEDNTIWGYHLPINLRLKLVSKISSFDRISNDY